MKENSAHPILSFLERNPEFNITTLAKASGIGRVTLSRIINAKQEPLYRTWEKIRDITNGEVTYVDLITYYQRNR